MADAMFKVPEPLPPAEEGESVELVTAADAGCPETSEESGSSVADEAKLPSPPASIFILEIVKNGTVVGSLDVKKPVIRFGRARDCDMPMDHPSISRYHAVLTWKPGPTKTGIFFLKDLNSTHGSFVNKKKIPAGLVARIEPNNSVIKLGGSSRNFILNSIVEFEDEEDAVNADEKEDVDDDEEMKETDPEVLYEEFVALVQNPSTMATKNEHVFSENPHRVLQQWFEREGLEFEYSVTQHGTKFKCSTDIPIEGRDVKIEGTEPQARKKDAIDHVCLIACRVLDQTLRLYPWQSSGKKRKKVRNSDDEDDDVLDETEEARSKKTKKSLHGENAETFESLMDKWNDCNEQLASCKANLVALSQKKHCGTQSVTPDQENDSLDSYMESISDDRSTRDIKIKQSQLKVKIRDLEKKQRVYELLMKAAKPITLPAAAEKQVQDVASVIVYATEAVTEKAVVGQEKKEEDLKMQIKPIAQSVLLATKAAAIFSEESESDAQAAKVTLSSDVPQVPPLRAKRIIHFTNPPTSSSANVERKSSAVKGHLMKQEEHEKGDFVDWCPPVDQDGSGKTSLNEKLGY